MIALILGAGAAGALIAWHMQRRPLPPLALSFARLLPEPRISAQKESCGWSTLAGAGR